MTDAGPVATTGTSTVPDAPTASASPDHWGELVRLVAEGSVLVLSGAGISTESGIPDYRGPTGIRRYRAPMTYQEFTGSEDARRRYWARSHVGWGVMARARPNAGHHAVAALQQRGLVDAVVTQNVDGLHQAAGADPVVELHGSLDQVVCLACSQRAGRPALQRRLEEANPGFRRQVDERTRVNPDGDVELDDALVESFRTVGCQRCGGVLKPDVVFFGENVPRPRVEQCYAMVDRARLLLVLGSSLTVMSGYRFVRHAWRRGTPVAIVNQGSTRGDEQASLRLDTPLGPTLARLASLTASPA